MARCGKFSDWHIFVVLYSDRVSIGVERFLILEILFLYSVARFGKRADWPVEQPHFCDFAFA